MSGNGPNPLLSVVSFNAVVDAIEQLGWPETILMAPQEWLGLVKQGAATFRDERGWCITIGPTALRPKAGTSATVDVSESGLMKRPRLVAG